MLIDDSEASKRAIAYLARLFRRSHGHGVSFRLAYLTSAPPARLLEFGGAESPTAEQRLTSCLRQNQRTWQTRAEQGPAAHLKRARAQLRRAGIDRASIDTCLSSPLDQRDPVEEVLLLVHDGQCDTIVVGHRAHHTWLGGAHDPLAERLIRTAKGLAVWVID